MIPSCTKTRPSEQCRGGHGVRRTSALFVALLVTVSGCSASTYSYSNKRIYVWNPKATEADFRRADEYAHGRWLSKREAETRTARKQQEHSALGLGLSYLVVPVVNAALGENHYSPYEVEDYCDSMARADFQCSLEEPVDVEYFYVDR